MGFHHFGQAGLELLISGDLPALPSQSPGTASMSHHAWTVCVCVCVCVCVFHSESFQGEPGSFSPEKLGR